MLKNISNKIKILAKWFSLTSFIGFILMLCIDCYISYSTQKYIYQDINQLPHRSYGLVLGTAKYYATGSPNLYYKYRLEAAQQLIEKQKVNFLLLSGDNKTPYYNEPKTMTNDLKKMGINEAFLKQDFAGYTTFDSIIRANQVFNLPPFIIVSQKFHCERAVFIAKYKNIDALCFIAEYPEGHIQVRVREFFARSLMMINLILKKE